VEGEKRAPVVSLPTNPSAIAVTTVKNMSLKKCLMSNVEVEYSLERNTDF
jgi:hypothetical protein